MSAEQRLKIYVVNGSDGSCIIAVRLIVGVRYLERPLMEVLLYIIESVDSISRDERDSPLMLYITNAGICRARYTITHFKHHHRVLLLFPIE